MSTFDKILKRKIAVAESHQPMSWSWERPKELIITEHDTIGSLLNLMSLHFSWWTTRWERMDELHQNALINLFVAHPQLLQHIWVILDKNLDEKCNLKWGKWRFDDLEFTLFERLGLMNDEIECEIYRLKPENETPNV